MHERRVGFQPDLLARIELVTFAEHGDDLLAAEFCEHLGLRARRFHHDDLGLSAVIGDREMLGPDAIDRRPAVGIGRYRFERQPDAVRALERRATIGLHLALEEVHRWRADESRYELVLLPVIEIER